MALHWRTTGAMPRLRTYKDAADYEAEWEVKEARYNRGDYG